MDTNRLIEMYGSYTFNNQVMRNRLPKATYDAFCHALETGEPLSKEIAAVIAEKMKEWAIELGATHFTHWFAPLTGYTAEKHDAFLEPFGDSAIFEFSGKMLRKGEPDASSFPSGGLRATFEARGYTAWDCTSNAFVKDNSLYIPTLFCSYTGESLDNKTPLLKSCDILNKEALRLLNLLGYKDVTRINSYVGSEQEYFLIPEELYEKRLDLKLTGRTLFGAPSPKGQEFEDHYFGSIPDKVLLFMKELDEELWKFGIPAKTKHNETAPAQHELACVYRSVNLTTDNNHLVMQLMKDIAKKHNLRCLLHEKPFEGVNGSGKHNNWSVVTNTGINLFKPGSDPANNIPFLATLACLIKGVDEYADLLRMSIATASNDRRLGGNEAPTTIISIFLGDELDQIIESIVTDRKIVGKVKDRFQTGVAVIPDFAKDNTDRNRTSPFAFTGNKFEYRAVGSSQSIATTNTMLNAILAYEMRLMSDEIASGKNVMDVIKCFLSEHKRIIYSGDGYSKEWEEEAIRRNLPNRKNAVEAIECLKDDNLTNILIELGIVTKTEIESRYEILLQSYSKTIQLEALTSLKMAKTSIYPTIINYIKNVSKTALNVKSLGISDEFLNDELIKLVKLINEMKEKMDVLEEKIKKVQQSSLSVTEAARMWHDEVLFSMEELRVVVDLLETMVDSSCWPMPTYVDLLFGI